MVWQSQFCSTKKNNQMLFELYDLLVIACNCDYCCLWCRWRHTAPKVCNHRIAELLRHLRMLVLRQFRRWLCAENGGTILREFLLLSARSTTTGATASDDSNGQIFLYRPKYGNGPLQLLASNNCLLTRSHSVLITFAPAWWTSVCNSIHTAPFVRPSVLRSFTSGKLLCHC